VAWKAVADERARATMTAFMVVCLRFVESGRAVRGAS